MKIMHLLPSLQSGGVEQVVLELCEGLAAAGAENVVVSAGGAMVGRLERTGARHVTMEISRKSPLTLFAAPRLKRLMEEEAPGVVHLHSRVPAWLGYLAWNRLPLTARPALVTTFHGFYSVNFYSKIMTCGRRVVAVSQCVRDHILAAYPGTPAGKIRVIPNSIDPALYSPDFRPSGEWLAEWQLRHPELRGKYTLCLPGRITRLKGHEDLVPILTALRAQGVPAHAVIVGETKKGKETYRRELADGFARAGLADAVTWAGHRTDLRSVLCACDAVLSLSHVPESFGKTTLEALALGRPVAGYAHGGVAEQLQSLFPDGLVPPGDTAAMAALLARWHGSPPAPPAGIPLSYRRSNMIEEHLRLYAEAAGAPD